MKNKIYQELVVADQAYKNNNGKKIVKHLFKLIERNPKKFIKNKYIHNDKYRSISDYISGMTDRYAIQLYKMSK